MLRRIYRAAVAPLATGAIALSLVNAAPPASAELVDTDNISRSTPNGHVFTRGVAKWTILDEGVAQNEFGFQWKVRLSLDGPRKSCARLRVTLMRNSNVQTRWPQPGTTKWGHYSLCARDGRASRIIGKTVASASPGSSDPYTHANINVCYAKLNRPNQQCYDFRINYED